jgi:hypothetical protein
MEFFSVVGVFDSPEYVRARTVAIALQDLYPHKFSILTKEFPTNANFIDWRSEHGYMSTGNCVILSQVRQYDSSVDFFNSIKSLFSHAVKPVESPVLLFIAGDKSQVGKSSVCLGLLGSLLQLGYKPHELAYIKPATQCESPQLVLTFS